PERHPLLELQCDALGDELGIELRPVNLLNVDEDLAIGALVELLLQLLDFRALAPDDDARAGGANRDAKLVARPIDFDRADPRRFQALAQNLFQLQIFMQQVGVALLGEPAGPPALVVAQSKSVRMNFLTHKPPEIW